MATMRAYKLQEFVAHASDVNCVKFGRRTSRILITGGDDQKVNLWVVGKPSAILSLSGFTSPVESVSFDSSEVMIGAGAASGTIKIWDVEEAKVFRTFTGHRSNCASLDFHPFGEFFASGSSDTNMKIWDIRKKGCIHTYKGHTRRIDVLRFTPDGRWIVSGGADNSVKIWDLTAGKLLHDFSLHEGPVNCLDFHPHEFLLATGSADKTVRFWDLETFELIGSSGPESSREYFAPASVVRSMTFNSDGKALFCGLHESLKVLSWEPIICHDVVDVEWSTLADLSVHEGKLLSFSYNQSCVGIWIVDLMQIEPYAVSNSEAHLNGSIDRPIQADNSISSVLGRLSVSRSPANEIYSNTLLKRPMSASKEIPVPASSAVTKRLSKVPGTSDLRLTRSDSLPRLSPRVRLNQNFFDDQRRRPADVVPLASPRVHSKADLSTSPRHSHYTLASAGPTYRPRSNMSAYNTRESFSIPVVVPRHSSKVDAGPNLSKVATTDLPVVEPQNIVKGDLAVDHGKEDGILVPVIDSRSSNMDVETGCTRIIGDVMHKIIPETSLRVNLFFLERAGELRIIILRRKQRSLDDSYKPLKGEEHGFRREAPESEKVQKNIFQSKPISSKRKFTREISGCNESVESNEVGDWYNVSGFEIPKAAVGKNPEFAHMNRRAVFGLSKLLESSEIHTVEHRLSSADYERRQYAPTLDGSRRYSSVAGEQNASASDEDALADLMENHQEFIHVVKSRLAKLEVVYRCWQNNDIKGSVDVMQRMLDHAVTADITSVLMENTTKYITLDICTSILPLASSLLESRYDRHLNIALEMILKLVKSFGATISSTLSAAPPVGVDLEVEQRLERCKLCFQELKKVNSSLVSLTRRQGEVGRSAQELSLFLQDIFQLSSS